MQNFWAYYLKIPEALTHFLIEKIHFVIAIINGFYITNDREANIWIFNPINDLPTVNILNIEKKIQ